MSQDKSSRRMTLRELITHAEKCSQNVIDHLQTSFLPTGSDFRDLSRPTRRRSHYPTMSAVENALKQLLDANAEVQKLTDELYGQIEEIRDLAKRERVSRL